MTIKATILGCGPSGGVPLICGVWGSCDSTQIKNRRTRTSTVVEVGGKNILIDASPDVRSQLLRENIQSIDAVLLTHAHFDHVGGLDDLRAFYYHQDKRRIPVYTNAYTLAALQQRVPYLLYDEGKVVDAQYPPFLDPVCIEYGSFRALGIDVLAFHQDHGKMDSIGFRIEGFAYSTDVKWLTQGMRGSLCNLEVWFVDCMSMHEKPTHSHLAQTLEWIDLLRPQKAYLIHMDGSMDYEALCQGLPTHVSPAYDGLCVYIG